jgi:hypothetical protein
MDNAPAPSTPAPKLSVIGAGKLSVLPDHTLNLQSVEFILAALICLGTFGALLDGKIDQGMATIIFTVIGTAFPGIGAWIRAKHIDRAADAIAAERDTAKSVAMNDGLNASQASPPTSPGGTSNIQDPTPNAQ